MNTYYVYTSGLDNALIIYYYEKLRNSLYTMSSYLSQSISKLDNVEAVIEQNYNIDDSKVTSVNIENIISTLKDRVSYLNNVIIPSVNSKIKSLK